VDLGGFHAIVANPIDGSVWGTVGVLAKTLLWPQITAKRFSRVPSMFDSLGVEVPYPT